jgi:hypothetical protein
MDAQVIMTALKQEHQERNQEWGTHGREREEYPGKILMDDLAGQPVVKQRTAGQG